MGDEKLTRMMAFWSDRAIRFGADPRSNTNDIWLREIELGCVEHVLQTYKPLRVLDFGCANGFTTRRLAASHPEINFTGVDINPDMIGVACAASKDVPNLTFARADVLVQDIGGSFDLIVAIRVFQNMESLEKQIRVFDRLCDLLNPRGCLYYIESYRDGYEQINRDRIALQLEPLPIHPHLTLLTDAFDRHATKRMALVQGGSPASSYYLITRLVYSKFAEINNEPIDYDHVLHRLAAVVPQIGEYGPEKSRLLRKRKRG